MLSQVAASITRTSDSAAARTHIEHALRLLAAGQSGIEQVQAVHLNAFLVLNDLGENERAQAELRKAVRIVEEKLADLREPAAKKAFLENLRVNRNIVSR